jgi:NADPH:quinone reductase-like Zn-dependent oxidoreductase
MLLQQHFEGSIDAQAAKFGLGASVDGTLRSFGAFDEQGLVSMPEGLSFIEAATLSCAGLTAWNALFGLPGKQLRAGQWVLTQGTGGVSLFAIQFAKATGARVIATTGSASKIELLKKLGADHIINYRDEPNWGAAAKDVTGGVGVDIVVDVVGPRALKQSVEGVKLDGLINVVGSVGGGITGKGAHVPTLLDCWTSLFTARGLWVGSRFQMEEMCRAIGVNSAELRPVIDSRIFKLAQVKEAYEYLASGKNVGKVCIEL